MNQAQSLPAQCLNPEECQIVKKLQEKTAILEKNYSELEQAIESSHDGMCIFNNEGLCIRMNRAAMKISGLKAEQVIGQKVKILEETGILNEAVTLKVLKEKKPVTILQTFFNGKYCIVTGSPIFDEKGEVVQVVTNLRDITELMALKDELLRSQQLNTRYLHELNRFRLEKFQAMNMVAASKQMQNILELVYRLSDVDTTILIQGESGVGKEVVANAIYEFSKRRHQGSFIKLNCSAIPEQLLESELFGYDSGAFTGARRGGKPGVFELAHQGILFLDEISELPYPLQAKLLRFLQDKEFLRVGGTKPVKVNVQIIAATSKDLAKLVKQNSFREDLYYRLNVVPITIPPLRERKGDIIPLVIHYLNKFNSRYGYKKIISSEAMNMLYNYQWPGNVRELANLVERLVVTVPEEIITAAELVKHINVHPENKKIAELPTLKEALENVEKELVLKAFEMYGNTYKAAEALGVSQSTVVRRLKKYLKNTGLEAAFDD